MDTNLIRNWRNLGIAFDISEEVQGDVLVDPEFTIVESLREVWGDPKFLRVVLAWFSTFGDLVNVSRLLAYLEKREMSQEEWRVLGGLARSRTALGDRRFLRIEYAVLRKMDRKWQENLDWMENFHAQRRGKNEAFAFFGLTVACPGTFEVGTHRKLLNRVHVLNGNPLLYIRAELGPTPRADALFFAEYRGGDVTAREVAAHALCSHGTAVAALKTARSAQCIDAAVVLADLKHQTGLTELELAVELGTSQPTISAIINRHRKVGKRFAAHMLRLLPKLQQKLHSKH